jgi:hypothetical protein
MHLIFQGEIKSRLKLRNACYHSVHKLLSSRFISINLKIKIYRTIILPMVLCGCEAWSLTLKEERRLRVFENRVLRRVFGPKRDEVTGEWRKLHNEELNDLYFLPKIVLLLRYSKFDLNYNLQLITLHNLRHIRGVSTFRVISNALAVSMSW